MKFLTLIRDTFLFLVMIVIFGMVLPFVVLIVILQLFHAVYIESRKSK